MVKGGGGGKQEECSEIKNIEEKSREELKWDKRKRRTVLELKEKMFLRGGRERVSEEERGRENYQII